MSVFDDVLQHIDDVDSVVSWTYHRSASTITVILTAIIMIVVVVVVVVVGVVVIVMTA